MKMTMTFHISATAAVAAAAADEIIKTAICKILSTDPNLSLSFSHSLHAALDLLRKSSHYPTCQFTDYDNCDEKRSVNVERERRQKFNKRTVSLQREAEQGI